MAKRLNQPIVRRTPLPLTERDLEDLSVIREPGPARSALEQLAMVQLGGGALTESALIHAIFEAGLRAVREAADDRGYAELAADEVYMDEMRRIARRPRPDWADETTR